MKKLDLAVVSVAAIVGCAAPAFSAPLQSWQFNPATNQLEIIVPAGVKPQYFFLAQPARIVVNLPGTQIGSVVPEAAYNGSIRQIRVSQFQPQLARIVLELAPNVALNAQQARLQQVKESNPGFDRWILRPALVASSTASPKTQAVFSSLRPAQTRPTAQAPSPYDLPPAPSVDAPIDRSAALTINAPRLPASAPSSPLPSGANPGSSLLFPDATPIPTSTAKPPTQPNLSTTGRGLALPEVNPSLAIPDSFPAITAPTSAPTVSVPPLERRSPSPDQPTATQPTLPPDLQESLPSNELAIAAQRRPARPVQEPVQARAAEQSRLRVPEASRVIEFGQPLPTTERP